jgi:hypothetical protein
VLETDNSTGNCELSASVHFPLADDPEPNYREGRMSYLSNDTSYKPTSGPE